MRKSFSWPRHWHAWLAITLLLPFLLVALTGFLFAHGNALGLRQIRVPVGWLPAYRTGAGTEIRSAVRTGVTWWLATPQGLVRIDAGKATLVPAFAWEDVRSLSATPQGPLVVTGKGLWREERGQWTKILKGPVTQASADGEVLTAMLRGKGGRISEDGGKTWQPLDALLQPALSTLPEASMSSRIPLSQLVHDVHTGKAFFTEKAAWLWQDLLALVLCFLSCSGFYMWRAKRRRSNVPA